MSEQNQGKRSLKRPIGARREAVPLADVGLVSVEPPPDDSSEPVVIRPTLAGLDVVVWATANRSLIDGLLDRHGAVLLRSFELGGLSGFGDLVKGVAGDPIEYRERSSPRTQVAENIYTSTEHPAHQAIFLHNENSYAHSWPLRLCFLCSTPARQGGETPIADCRRVFRLIDPRIRDKFIEKRVMYVRTFSEGLGLSWQTVFGTSDRDAVTRQCRQAGYTIEWTSRGLRTRRVGQAVARHPRTGEMAWFNHATFFHVSTLEPEIGEALLAQYGEDGLPNNTYYGDGTPIEASVLDQLRSAYLQAKVKQPWQAMDILLLDNVLAAHGREPYAGPRRVHVAMSQPRTEDDIR